MTLAIWGFVTKDSAVDTGLSAVVDKLSPNKHGVCVAGSEHDMLAGTDKLTALSSVSVIITGIMSFIKFKAR